MFLKYNDSDETYAINSFSKIGNVVTIRGDSLPENTSGFKIILNGKVIEDCSDFTTRYDTLGKLSGIAYSNDGSTETEENPLVREMTEEQKEEQAKQEKILEIESRIAEIDEWLVGHDYIGIKIATGRATAEEYAEIIAKMDEYAKEKEELLLQLKEVQCND